MKHPRILLTGNDPDTIPYPLHRLPHNAIIRATDFITAIENSPGGGFIPATNHAGYPVSSISDALVVYRPTKPSVK